MPFARCKEAIEHKDPVWVNTFSYIYIDLGILAAAACVSLLCV